MSWRSLKAFVNDIHRWESSTHKQNLAYFKVHASTCTWKHILMWLSSQVFIFFLPLDKVGHRQFLYLDTKGWTPDKALKKNWIMTRNTNFLGMTFFVSSFVLVFFLFLVLRYFFARFSVFCHQQPGMLSPLGFGPSQWFPNQLWLWRPRW